MLNAYLNKFESNMQTPLVQLNDYSMKEDIIRLSYVDAMRRILEPKVPNKSSTDSDNSRMFLFNPEQLRKTKGFSFILGEKRKEVVDLDWISIMLISRLYVHDGWKKIRSPF